MHKQLEDYMAQVAQQIASVPKPRRDEELREMRAHLVMAVAANQEQGQAESAAMASALEAFGTPDEASAGVLAAWRDSVRKDARKAFGRVGVIWSVFAGFMASSNNSDRRGWLLLLACIWLVCFAGMFVLPLWYLRTRPVRSSVRQRQ